MRKEGVRPLIPRHGSQALGELEAFARIFHLHVLGALPSLAQELWTVPTEPLLALPYCLLHSRVTFFLALLGLLCFAGFSLVVKSGGYSLLKCVGFSLR